MDVKKDILWRVYLCYIGVIMLGLFVLGRAFYIQRVEGSKWRAMGDSLHLTYKTTEAERGTIFSEDGNILSTSVPVFDVFLDFGSEGVTDNDGIKFKESLDTLSRCLATLFHDKTPDAYKKELLQVYKNEERYYAFKKKITFDDYLQMNNFPFVKMGPNKSGFRFEKKDKRINPYVLLANRTIGLSRDDAKKNVGLEQRYDSLLRGTPGKKLVRSIGGQWVEVDGSEIESENGKDIVTTLDTYIQDVSENALMKMLIDNNSEHGTAIVMETATGKIKAIANLGLQKDKNGNILKDKNGVNLYAEDLNYGIAKATEPGSIFKLATLMSLLEDKYITISTKVNCEGGSKEFYGLRIKDTHPNGEMSVKEAFAASSNVAFAKLADQYYHSQPSKFIQHLHDYRLDTLTGIDITAASGRPTIKKPSNKRTWANTTIPFMAHGYEELVTPLHMLVLYNSVANNGTMMKPYLVNEIREYGNAVKIIKPEVLVQKICSDETLRQLKECLLAVVDSAHGTAHKVVFDSVYSIAGKTGTAVSALDNRGYNKGNKIYQASFIGYFPADRPKYTIAVVIQNTRESKLVYGADVSGTVFKEISDKLYGHYLSSAKMDFAKKPDTIPVNYYGLKKDLNAVFSTMRFAVTDATAGNRWAFASMVNTQVQYQKPANNLQTASVIPGVTGMGLKDAVDVLENMGLKVSVKGRGKVVSQSLPPGTSINKGQIVSLILD